MSRSGSLYTNDCHQPAQGVQRRAVPHKGRYRARYARCGAVIYSSASLIGWARVSDDLFGGY